MTNVTDGLARQAAERPWAVAVLQGGKVIHYRTLEETVRRAVSWLARHGVRKGQVVGLSMVGPLPHLIVALALARMGAIQLALAPREPIAARRRIASLAGATLLVSNQADAGDTGLAVLKPAAGWLEGAATAASGAGAAGGEDPWLVCQSSGTTGEPKLFHLTHDDAIARERRRNATRSGFRPDDVFHTAVTLDFSGNKLLLLNCLSRGGCLVLDRPKDGAELIRLLDARRVTYLQITPPQIASLLSRLPGQGVRFPHLRAVRVGAGASSEELRRSILERFSPNLFIAYGTNDAGSLAVADPETLTTHPGTVGTMFEGVRWQVVDEEDRPVAPGTPGRLRVAGPGVVRGYLDAAQTARSFKDGWFYPGDIVSADSNGRLTFHGRADDMMNLDGINIFPAEIEQVLLGHPAVAEAAAFPLRVKGDRDLPMAAVVLRGAAEEGELAAFCREELGVRAPWRVLVVPELPRNAVGKVLRRELSARMASAVTAARHTREPAVASG